ncbi:MAG: hydantoinase/oxoprolinase family protein [Pseudomonadota bacterium]
MGYRIGADIGGTFTDLALVDGAGTRFEIGKILTTPAQPDDAVIAGIAALLARTGLTAGEIDHVVHGTTLFTNALIERKGATTALITTRGFRDAVEIGREHRYDMYDLRMERPAPIAPRRRRFEVTERVLACGTVRTPLNEAEARALARSLPAQGIEAVGICFLHAYANPSHEARMEAILAKEAPGLAVTRSSALAPEIREYERTSTVLANVYVQRIAERYLGRLAARLRDEIGIPGPLYIMQSNGGLAEVATAQRFPIRLVESGPAAGALAAAHFGARLGARDLLSFDMGGTTAKACVIADGAPLIATEFEVDRRYQFKKGSGLPVKVPVVEMIEIGTGGGSIARIDSLDRLTVGPESAGAQPGPACYGQGGTRPTVTDADLCLGFLDPGFFLGGTMKLDCMAAEAALAEEVGRPLNLTVPEAAWSVHRLANEAMAAAARLHAVERGVDVEKLALFAFGGAGPVHAYGVGRILRVPRIFYPLGAGVMSAAGFLTAPLSFDFVRSLPNGIDALDWPAAQAAVAEMAAKGREILTTTLAPEAISLRLYADMRYRKQGYEVRTAVPEAVLAGRDGPALRAAFEAAYRALYGHTVPDTGAEVVSWRVIVEGPKPDLRIGAVESASGASLKGNRRIWVVDQGFAEVPVHDRYRLAPGTALQGPVVIEERESTTVINGPGRVTVDAGLNLTAELSL